MCPSRSRISGTGSFQRWESGSATFARRGGNSTRSSRPGGRPFLSDSTNVSSLGRTPSPPVEVTQLTRTGDGFLRVTARGEVLGACLQAALRLGGEVQGVGDPVDHV